VEQVEVKFVAELASAVSIKGRPSTLFTLDGILSTPCTSLRRPLVLVFARLLLPLLICDLLGYLHEKSVSYVFESLHIGADCRDRPIDLGEGLEHKVLSLVFNKLNNF